MDPIPIAPWILEKAGFSEIPGSQQQYKLFLGYGYLYASRKCNEVWFQHDVDGNSYFLHDAEIRYLHQLQNLYRSLTGKELVISLW